MKTLVYFISLLFSLSIGTSASAATLSYSGEEVEYTYEVSFRTLIETSDGHLGRVEALEQGKWHSDHLFGLFHAPDYTVRYGIPEELIEGFAGTKHPSVEDAFSSRKDNDENYWVTYKARGTMLVMKPVVNAWLGRELSGSVKLPMLINMPKIYNADVSEYADSAWEKCTDEHYNTPYDFSYFYNPFKCKALAKPPIGAQVALNIRRLLPGLAVDTKIPLKEIRSDNGNGKLVMLYFINGFYENPVRGDDQKVIHADDGWKLFSSLDQDFIRKFKFERMQSKDQFRKTLGEDVHQLPGLLERINSADYFVDETHDYNRVYYRTYVRRYAGKVFVIRMNLSNTENEQSDRPLKTFPKFWKEAWENGDFIYYGGHSGDGVTMDPAVMQNNLNAIYNPNVGSRKGNLRLSSARLNDTADIQFQTDKTQIMIFDACSSYAHYQDPYRLKNPKLHLMTYGLVSLFHLAQETVVTMVDMIINQKSSIPWVQALGIIEKNQLKPHIAFSYDMTAQEVDADEDYQRYLSNKQYPGLLLNVAVPDQN